ncbi:MAG: hypothetical protein ABR964_04030 [Tepidisphaeraceae bacterium]|jgi:hypothetical protein
MGKGAFSVGVQGTSQGRYYAHSGQIPPLGLIGGIAAAVIVAPWAALAYVYCDVYIAFLYIKFLLTIAFGMVLGWAPAAAMRAGKVRNAALTQGMGLLSAALGYYCCWVLWIYVLLAKAGRHILVLPLAQSPQRLIRVIVLLNQSGTWGLKGSHTKVTGGALWFVWLLEAAIIFWFALKWAWRIASERPFCESCGRWCDKPRSIGDTDAMEGASLRQRLEAGDWAVFSQLVLYPGGPGHYLRWEQCTCPACKEFSTLSVTDVNVTRDGRGRTSRKERCLVRHLLLDGEAIQRLTRAPAPATTEISCEPVLLPASPQPSPPPPAAPSPPLQPPPSPPPQPAPRGDQLLDL